MRFPRLCMLLQYTYCNHALNPKTKNQTGDYYRHSRYEQEWVLLLAKLGWWERGSCETLPPQDAVSSRIREIKERQLFNARPSSPYTTPHASSTASERYGRSCGRRTRVHPSTTDQ